MPINLELFILSLTISKYLFSKIFNGKIVTGKNTALDSANIGMFSGKLFFWEIYSDKMYHFAFPDWIAFKFMIFLDKVPKY